MANHTADTAAGLGSGVVILGVDVLLASRPATPVQVAQACFAAGFRDAVPASWGDEIVAAACARAVRERGKRPLIMCACPRVAQRLLSAGDELESCFVSLVPPPVAAARYVRAGLANGDVHITYVGDCPGAVDDAIDQRISPAAFLAILAAQGIVLVQQPKYFDSVIPADRRRFASVPGGTPTVEFLRVTAPGHSLLEVDDDDFASPIAQRLLAGDPVVIDVATRMHCVCSGAVAGVPASQARAEVTALEPPRARSSVVDDSIAMKLNVRDGAKSSWGSQKIDRGSPVPSLIQQVDAAQAPLLPSTPSQASIRVMARGSISPENLRGLAANRLPTAFASRQPTRATAGPQALAIAIDGSPPIVTPKAQPRPAPHRGIPAALVRSISGVRPTTNVKSGHRCGPSARRITAPTDDEHRTGTVSTDTERPIRLGSAGRSTPDSKPGGTPSVVLPAPTRSTTGVSGNKEQTGRKSRPATSPSTHGRDPRVVVFAIAVMAVEFCLGAFWMIR